MSERPPSFEILQTKKVLQTVQWHEQPHANFDRRQMLRQVTVPGGIHSCFLTTALNGGIVGGYLTREEAAYAQGVLTSPSHSNRWSEREIRGTTILTWSGDISQSVNEVVGKRLPFRYITEQWCDIKDTEFTTFLRARLVQGYTISWGDGVHQRLAVGFAGTSETTLVDPFMPELEATAPIEAIAGLHQPAMEFAIIGDYDVLEEREVIESYQ
jgi:hypothetical protein